MRIRWTDHAKAQLRAVRSDDLLARVRRRMRLLRRYPRSGRIVPELRREDCREVIVGVLRIGYHLHDRELVVVVVQDARQEFHWSNVIAETAAPYIPRVTAPWLALARRPCGPAGACGDVLPYGAPQCGHREPMTQPDPSDTMLWELIEAAWAPRRKAGGAQRQRVRRFWVRGARANA